MRPFRFLVVLGLWACSATTDPNGWQRVVGWVNAYTHSRKCRATWGNDELPVLVCYRERLARPDDSSRGGSQPNHRADLHARQRP